MATTIQLTIDCASPTALGAFWAEALHYVEQPPPSGHANWPAYLEAVGVPPEEWDDGYSVMDPDNLGPTLYFQRVPEGKVVKNRLHIDVLIGGGGAVPVEQRRPIVEAEAARLQTLGARILSVHEEQGFAIAMADPEGNEFDVV